MMIKNKRILNDFLDNFGSMGSHGLSKVVRELQQQGQLMIITEEVNPDLEMAAIHRKVNAAKGPAILFEKVKGSPFPAVSNLFGTFDRAKFIFRDQWETVKKVLRMRQDPTHILQDPFGNLSSILASRKAFPTRSSSLPSLFGSCKLSDLPAIKSWPLDGGRFITLPLVYSEDPSQPGVKHSNLGMYRVQVNGNEFLPEKECGLHYQIHRGIGIHHSIAAAKGEKLRVTVFVGGSPAHTLAAVMPLPEGISELMFAGLLDGRRFRYGTKNGYFIPADADFVITGTIDPNRTKPEGPFGDHLGYYSLKHEFPVLEVDGVYHKKDPIWPFTVVGRPPQEDSVFGEIIHELTGDLIPAEIPGVKEVNAVDEAGVHPLLLAIGKERYTPYTQEDRPAEILTTANRILGTGQLSLAKFLIIGTDDHRTPSVKSKEAFITHILERIDPTNDLHFQTQTTIDTLDYSGTGLNRGSKMILAAGKNKKRNLSDKVPDNIHLDHCSSPIMIAPGVMCIVAPSWNSQEDAEKQMQQWARQLEAASPEYFIGETRIPFVTFVNENAIRPTHAFSDWLWVTFTRCNPSHDVHGVRSSYAFKHWSCAGSILFDARIKSHHAPALLSDESVEERAESLIRKYGHPSR